MRVSDKKLTLKSRAKTFYFASLFFSKEIRLDIEDLYLFCRYVDDISDHSNISTKEAKKNLQKIKKEIQNNHSTNIIVKKFLKLMIKYQINSSTPLFLIEGVLDDLKEVNLKNFDQLIEYSYKVAGTVGLMMCRIMKVRDNKLKFKGIQLGIAMQLTNISRDIEEDLKRKRIYLPKSFRSFKHENYDEITQSINLKKTISQDLKKIICEADKIYLNAWDGISELPIKYKIPIAIASELYQSIGKKIRKKKFDIWNKRIFLTRVEKIFFAIKALIKVFSEKNISQYSKLEKRIHLILQRMNKSYCE